MKKKRQTPKKTSKQVIKSANKQRESAYKALFIELDKARSELIHATDRIRDLLKPFKRMSKEDKWALFEFIEAETDRLDHVLDQYYDATGHGLEDSDQTARDVAGAIGLTMGLVSLLGKSGDQRPRDPEWPEAIDIEGKRVEPDPPKELKGK